MVARGSASSDEDRRRRIVREGVEPRPGLTPREREVRSAVQLHCRTERKAIATAHPTKSNATQRHEPTGCSGARSMSLDTMSERIMCVRRGGVPSESARFSRDERCASNGAPLMGYLGRRDAPLSRHYVVVK